MKVLISHWMYLKYVLRHKWFVLMAGLKLHVPLWQLIIHDWTKFLPSEWTPYVHYFYRKDLQEAEMRQGMSDYGVLEAAPYGVFIEDRFNMAWNLHQKRNKHHWQYWVLMNDDGPVWPMPIPDRYMREMVADWCGAGRAITGKWDVRTWYDKNKDKIQIRNKELVEILITQFETATRGQN